MAKLLYKDRQDPQPSRERGAVRRQISRNHQFDLLRIIFATLVLLSHAPEITDGNVSRELFHRFTRAPMTFGTVGVDGFFLLSGYLIVQSWLANPELLNFLRKRVLRIVPGYLVAVVLSTLAVGLLAPGVSHFFRGLDVHFVRSVALLSSPITPPVFPGRPYAMVNGAMYTIAYEFRCYLLVALLGLCGLLRRPIFVMAITLLLLFSLLYAAPFERMHWPRHVEALIGQPIYVFRLTAVYLTGCCFYLFRGRIAFRPQFALAATILMIACFVFAPSRGELAMVLCARLPDVLPRPDATDLVVRNGTGSRTFPTEFIYTDGPSRVCGSGFSWVALGYLSWFHCHLFWTWMVELALRRASRTFIEEKAVRSIARCLSIRRLREPGLTQEAFPG